MQIIWNQEAVSKLKNNHTLLELETFVVNGQPITAYCVVPLEKVVKEITELENNKHLHSEFVKSFNEKNYDMCNELYQHLLGKFGGELDSFYEEIINKIKTIT